MSFPNLWPAATGASASPSRQALLLPLIPTSLLLLAPAAQAHHLMDLLHLQPTPLSGLLSGLAHPVLGPDHLVFLLALSLVGLGHRSAWMLALLLIGLAGSLLGVLGWTQGPLVTYLVGLFLGEGLLLLLAMTVLRRLAAPGGEGLRRLLAGVLIGCGATWTWSALVP